MTRRFEYEGEEWEVKRIGAIIGSASAMPPQTSKWGVGFTRVSDSKEANGFIDKPNVDGVSEGDLREALKKALE